MRPSLLFVALLAAVTSVPASGQAATRDSSRVSAPVVTHVLKTVQGSTFLGRLVQDAPGSDSVRFETGGAELVVARTAILSLTAVRPTTFMRVSIGFLIRTRRGCSSPQQAARSSVARDITPTRISSSTV